MTQAPLVSRRRALAAGALAPLVLAAPSAQAVPKLDLSTPRAQLTAFMKLLTSVKAETVFYWYTGVIDVAAPGHPICAVDGSRASLGGLCEVA